jgi:hypothetical protein
MPRQPQPVQPCHWSPREPNNTVLGYAVEMASNVQDQVAQCTEWMDDTL